MRLWHEEIISLLPKNQLLGQHISEFYSTLVPENIFFQGMRISYVFQKDTEPLTTEVARFLSTI